MKKLLSLFLTLAVVLTLTVPALAVDVTINSTNDSNTDATYDAYQLLHLTTSLKCGETHDHTESCYNYSYTLNSKYQSIMMAAAGVTTAATGKTLDQTVMDALAGMDGRALAETIYAAVLDADLTADANLQESTAASLDQGYWLIVDTDVLEEGEVRSLVMLDTAGQEEITLTAKDDTMTLEKTVNLPSVDIGDTVTFTLTSAQLPAQLADYDYYVFTITDTMSAGLDYMDDSLSITIGGTEITPTTVPAIVEDAETGVTTFTIVLGDYILANKAACAGQAVVVTYNAMVNEDAVLGAEGNPNEATLKYTNDPSLQEDHDTPPTEIKVYSAKIIIDKYDGADQTTETKLADAVFALYKEDDQGAKLYYAYNDGDVSWVDSLEDATTHTTDANGAAEFVGLKSGTYYLEETQAPDGFNLLAEPVEVTITNTGDTAYANQTSCIANNSGFELPSTGGMGTTVFYVFGGALMAAAGILLITKRKMANQA